MGPNMNIGESGTGSNIIKEHLWGPNEKSRMAEFFVFSHIVWQPLWPVPWHSFWSYG